MRATELLQKSKKELEKISSQAYQEGLWILADVLKLSTSEVYFEKENITLKQQNLFFDKVKKRKQGEPLEYILQEKVFFKQKFSVDNGVFIPRQETETLIHWVLNYFQKARLKIIDFGAGTGTLCLTLLSLLKESECIAVEISNKAIECLKKNSRAFDMEKRLHILKKEVCQVSTKELLSFLGEEPFLIVANPPYIDPKDPSINKEVYFFDPPLALFSDKEGMGHIYSWFHKAMDLLSSNGVYIFEFGWNQSKKVREFFHEQKALCSYEIHKDPAGNPRMAVCFKK